MTAETETSAPSGCAGASRLAAFLDSDLVYSFLQLARHDRGRGRDRW